MHNLPKNILAIYLLMALLLGNTGFSQKLVEHKNKRGELNYVEFDIKSGAIKAIHKFNEKTKNYGLDKNNLSKGNIAALGKKLIDDYSEMLGASAKDFTLDGVSQSGELWITRYAQLVNGIQIEYSNLSFTVAKTGDIISFNVNVFPNPVISNTLSLTSEHAVQLVQNLSQLKPETKGKDKPQPVILPSEAESGVHLRLAWKVWILGPPATLVYYVDATNGEVLRVVNNTVDLSVF